MIQKISALVMAFFMLASTASWTIEKHYCLGSLVDIAFFHEADSCCGINVVSVNNRTSSDKESNSCCSDEIISVHGQDDLSIPYQDFDLVQPFFLEAFASYCIKLFQPRANPIVPFEDYPPPLLVKDIQILDQVFLI